MKLAVTFWLVCGLALGQVPRIGVIDFYGLQKVSANKLRLALGVEEGDPLPPSKADAEERLQSVDGVVLAELHAVCCEGGKAILFVGIEEKGAQHFNFHEAPESDVTLPAEMVETYGGYLAAIEASARSNSASTEVDTWEKRLASLAEAGSKTLREVLRTSVDADQRVIAASMMAFSSDRPAAAQDLQYALQDPDEDVRQNALRSLGTIAAYAYKHPDSEIQIPPTWPVQMLNSLAWGDRIGAVNLLLTLTEKRDPEVLSLIRERALPQIAEMARWKSLTHALPAFVLLGRLGGLTEPQIQENWSKGERDDQVAAMERSLKTVK